MGLRNLISEENAKSLHYPLRRAALHNFLDFVGQADGDELFQRGYAAQDHVTYQPLYIVLKARWQDPVSNKARLCCHSLHGIKRQDFGRRKWKLTP